MFAKFAFTYLYSVTLTFSLVHQEQILILVLFRDCCFAMSGEVMPMKIALIAIETLLRLSCSSCLESSLSIYSTITDSDPTAFRYHCLFCSSSTSSILFFISVISVCLIFVQIITFPHYKQDLKN